MKSFLLYIAMAFIIFVSVFVKFHYGYVDYLPKGWTLIGIKFGDGITNLNGPSDPFQLTIATRSRVLEFAFRKRFTIRHWYDDRTVYYIFDLEKREVFKIQ